ncbi:MAG: 4-hydroxythreonine-4-phosphate dehydrogenase PdxA [Pseudomonadota bacterium]
MIGVAARRLLITPGEPAGIGPELLVRLAQTPPADCELVAVCDPSLLTAAATRLGLPLGLSSGDETSAFRASTAGAITVWPLPLAVAATPGQLDVRNAPYVLATLRRATAACLAGHAAALVTGPIHKGVINDAGAHPHFTGHTEFLAELTGAALPVMLLTAGSLRVALVTTHLPLSAVPAAITPDSLTATLRVLHADLISKFGIARPRILVTGLNPHAGEGGHLGREEIDVIEPTLQALRAEGMQLEGPLPADTLFTPAVLARGDAVLAMYHDQGLPVLKHVGFGHAINITLGLPIIRTSVDHGVALDLAGTGRADAGSLAAAIDCALHLSRT